jgi:negative regulator of sigma-B (phosphoserine phosphatase)
MPSNVKTNGSPTNPLVEWGASGRAIPGQAVSGDLCLVKPFDHGTLAAVVDGLGHGDEATAAAKVAVCLLEEHAGEPVSTLIQRCHERLMKTRGGVMTLASFNSRDDTVTCLGVGNVEALLVRANGGVKPVSESIVLGPGVVGYQLPALRASVLSVSFGDLLILASDGIRAGFDQDLSPGGRPQQIADNIMNRHYKGNDDAQTLVVRYLGKGHE